MSTVFTLAPQHPTVLIHRSNILTGLGRTEEALKLYAASLAARPLDDHRGRSIVLNQRGVLFNETQRYREAEEAYTLALRETPGIAPTWRNRAKNLNEWGEQSMRVGEQAQAREHFQQALECARESWRINRNDQQTPFTLALIGDSFNDLKMYAEAEAAYALAVEGEAGKDDAATWFNRALNLLQWGHSEVQAGQTAAGREHLRAALGYAQEAQQRDSTNPQLSSLLKAIQAALAQAQG